MKKCINIYLEKHIKDKTMSLILNVSIIFDHYLFYLVAIVVELILFVYYESKVKGFY